MRKLLVSLLGASLIAAPLQARDLRDQTIDTRSGTFVGAQLHVPFGGKIADRPRVSLGISPTRSRISNAGMVHTNIGEGLALSFTPDSKPTLTFAGVRADEAFGLKQSGAAGAEREQGVSTGGWIAIGVGTVALVAVGGLYLWAEHISYCEERDC